MISDRCGTYILKHPLWLIARPRLHITKEADKKRHTGELRLPYKRVQLHLIKQSQDLLFFQFYIDIFPIDMVLHFYRENALKGFIDTPLGHFNFSGQKITR